MTIKQGFARKWLIAGLTAVTTTAGLVAGVAGPAAADPVTTLVGVGSDTTQDVMDAVAIQIGGGVLGSWDAVNPVDHVTAHEAIAPKAGCTMTRPNGSGEGVTALRQALGSTVAGLADRPEPGCVDFARSSGGPGTNASVTGQLVYVPFALDAVATATGPATATAGAVATNITDANLFTVADLQTMYQTCTGVTPSGATKQYVPDGTVTDATHQPVHLYVPQSGSGTRAFWLQQMGLSTSGSLPACVHDTFTLNGTSTIVQEHDGTVFATDANGFGPFSIAQWVAQRNGHNDRRHDAVLHNANGVAPLSGTALNPAYPIKREVYNVVSFSRVTSTATADRQFVSIFAGSTSATCANAANILSYGFGLLNTAPLGHTCGQIAANLRAFDTI
jgi:hypothetical protein